MEVRHSSLVEKSKSFFLIIVFYFENVAFLYAKLGSDVCPRVDEPNLWQHCTRFNSTTKWKKSSSACYPPMGIGAGFCWRVALPHQPVRVREEILESENRFSGS